MMMGKEHTRKEVKVQQFPDISMGTMFLSVIKATTEKNSSNMRQNISMISR
jgi:hypothetical protein